MKYALIGALVHSSPHLSFTTYPILLHLFRPHCSLISCSLISSSFIYSPLIPFSHISFFSHIYLFNVFLSHFFFSHFFLCNSPSVFAFPLSSSTFSHIPFPDFISSFLISTHIISSSLISSPLISTSAISLWCLLISKTWQNLFRKAI